MREMKDSGILWIGMMPIGWRKTCLSYISSSRSGGTPNRDNPLFWQGGTIPWMSSGEVNKEQVWETKEKITQLGSDNSSAKLIRPNSVMVALNGQGKTKGMAAVLKIEATCNQSLCAIHCDDNTLYYQYLYYCFKTMYKYLRSQAGDDVRDGLAASFVVKQVVPIPPRDEQQIIADFLDRKCADIDDVLEKTRASIDEYKKLKQSVITEAVTKGIRGERPVKESGSTWFGQVPATWEANKLKYTFTIRKRIVGEDGHTVLAITQKGVKPKDMSNGNGQFAESYANYQIVHPGDFAMNHMDLLTGWVDISKYEGVTSPDYRVFTLDDTTRNYPDYYLYMMQMCYSNRIFYSMGQGVSGMGRWRLPADMFNNFIIACPPYEEQQEIAEYLDKKCSEIDSLIASKEKFITELEAYKKSLIYEYVTGKKEVL